MYNGYNFVDILRSVACSSIPLSVCPSVCRWPLGLSLHISYISRLGKLLEVCSYAEHNVRSYDMGGGGSPPLTLSHLHSPRLITCSQHVHNMFMICSWHVQDMFNEMCMNCSTKCSWHLHHVFMTCLPQVHHMFTTCLPHVRHMFTTCLPHVHHIY